MAQTLRGWFRRPDGSTYCADLPADCCTPGAAGLVWGKWKRPDGSTYCAPLPTDCCPGGTAGFVVGKWRKADGTTYCAPLPDGGCCAPPLVTVGCCPGQGVSQTLYTHFSGGTGNLAALDGQSVQLSYAGGGGWTNAGPITFGGKTFKNLVFYCPGSSWSWIMDGPLADGIAGTDDGTFFSVDCVTPQFLGTVSGLDGTSNITILAA